MEDYSFYNRAKISIDFINPDKDIYNFNGQLKNMDNGEICKLELKQFLPRGSILRDSGDVYGLIVYTGEQTKL